MTYDRLHVDVHKQCETYLSSYLSFFGYFVGPACESVVSRGWGQPIDSDQTNVVFNDSVFWLIPPPFIMAEAV